MSPAISHDASESEMKTALESLDNIHSVSVLRSGPDSQGGYEWKVTFLPSDLYPELNHGDLPLLVVFSNSLDATWSGLSDQISVIKTRAGSSLTPVPCTKDCSHIIAGLKNDTEYTFRVRAKGQADDWSTWSVHSKPVRTCRLAVPEAPTMLMLSSVTNNSITMKWESSDDVLTYEFQQKCKGMDIIWRSVRSEIAPRPLWTTGTSTFIPGNTECM